MNHVVSRSCNKISSISMSSGEKNKFVRLVFLKKLWLDNFVLRSTDRMVQKTKPCSEKLFLFSPKSLGIPKMKLSFQDIDWEFRSFGHKEAKIGMNELSLCTKLSQSFVFMSQVCFRVVIVCCVPKAFFS